MSRWKDTSTYDDGDRTPWEWTLETGRITVIVHRHQDFPPDRWLVATVPALWDAPQPLQSYDVAEAKAEAIDHVKHTLRGMLSSI